jgi:large subunit ribosomal protein L9
MATAIRVVLQEDVDNLGTSGDVVRVRPGYARNFLIPRGLAAPATENNLARIGELKRIAAERAHAALDEAKKFAAKLENNAVKIERAVGEENKMYGSVTAKDIEAAFAAQGLEIDRRKLELSEPIKQLGLSEVTIRLHAEVKASLRVEVIKKS